MSGHLRTVRRNRAEGDLLHGRQRESMFCRRKTVNNEEGNLWNHKFQREQTVLKNDDQVSFPLCILQLSSDWISALVSLFEICLLRLWHV